MEKEKMFYSPREVAELLNVTSATVRNLVKRGEIPAIRIGAAYRVKKEVIDKLMEG